MALQWDYKDPDEVLDYQVDWSIILGADTIVTSMWIMPDGIEKGEEGNTAKVATIWLSGGSEGSKYVVTNRITTAAGRVLDQSVILEVHSR